MTINSKKRKIVLYLSLGLSIGLFEKVFWDNKDLTGFISFNLQLISTLALIYFAMKQYNFKRREHHDPEFSIERITANTSLKGLPTSDMTFEERLVDLPFQISIVNTGKGYGEVVKIENMSIDYEVYSKDEEETFKKGKADLDLNMSLLRKMRPGDSVIPRFKIGGEKFRDKKLINLVKEGKEIRITSILIKFTYASGERWVEKDTNFHIPEEMRNLYYGNS